jgi:hypothetical protein
MVTNCQSPNVSPGLPNVSPGLPNVSPGLPNVSPGLPNVSPGLPNVAGEQHDGKQCEKCGKIYHKKAINRHIRLCKGAIGSNQCYKCLAIFTTRSAKCKHVKICTEIAKDIRYINNTTINNNNNMINSNNTNNFYININPVGSESLKHLTQEDLLSIAMNLVDYSGVCRYLEKVNFNPDVVENHNVRLTDGFTGGRYKEQLVAIKTNDNTWVVQCQTMALQELIKAMSGHMHKFMHQDSIKEIFFKNVEEDDLIARQQMLDIQEGIHELRHASPNQIWHVRQSFAAMLKSKDNGRQAICTDYDIYKIKSTEKQRN